MKQANCKIRRFLHGSQLADKLAVLVDFSNQPRCPGPGSAGQKLTDCCDGFPRGVRYLLMDRDDKFCHRFRDVLEHAGMTPVLLLPRSPNLTPHIERFIGSIKQECFSRLIFFGEHSLRHAIRAYLVHHHQERNHQGLGNRILMPGDEVGRASGEIRRRERLGGLLRYYYRKAACPRDCSSVVIGSPHPCSAPASPSTAIGIAQPARIRWTTFPLGRDLPG